MPPGTPIVYGGSVGTAGNVPEHRRVDLRYLRASVDLYETIYTSGGAVQEDRVALRTRLISEANFSRKS